MIYRTLQHTVTKILILIAIIPLLIGHGLGSLGDGPTPALRNFVISGSSNPGTDINIADKLVIKTDDFVYSNPPGTNDGMVSPLSFSSYSSYLDVLVNSPNPGGSALGELWIHENSRSLKLIHPAVTPSFIDVKFNVSESQFDLPQSSTIASSSSYTLSAGSSGSEFLMLHAHVEIFVNNKRIFLHAFADDLYVAPIPVNAKPGDKLRILVGGAVLYESTASFWLHNPDGTGIKLLQSLYEGSITSKAFIDVTYDL